MSILSLFKEYIKDKKVSILAIGIIILMVYGIKLFNLSLSIDNEAAISVSSSIYSSWEGMGRIGIPLIKKIMGLYIYNPYIAMFLMILLQITNCIIYGFIFDFVTSFKKKNSMLLFSLFLISSPILAEQLGFVMQSVEILIGSLCVGISLLFYFKYLNEKKIIYIVFSIVLASISFSIYQAFTTVFITMAIALYILYIDKKEFDSIYCWKIGLGLLIIFVASYIFYAFFTKIYFYVFNLSSSDYTSGQIMWGKESIVQIIKNLIIYVKQSLFAKKIFYSYSLLIIYILILINLIVNIVKKRNNYLYFLSFIALLFTPFLMGIILGQIPTVRTELSKVYMIAFSYMYIFDEINRYDFIYNKIIMLLLSIFMISNQIIISSRLYYTEYVTNIEQYAIATKISGEIQAVCGEYSPSESVVFIGSVDLNRNPSCFCKEDLELIGYSFFEVSFSVNQGTYLIRNYLCTLGYDFTFPTEAEIQFAEKESQKMPCWPNKDSIKKINGIVIVKLSNC